VLAGRRGGHVGSAPPPHDRAAARRAPPRAAGNWWEDRQQQGPHLDAQALAATVQTAERCMPWREERAALLQTAAQADAARRAAEPPPAPRRARRLAAMGGGAAAALAAHAVAAAREGLVAPAAQLAAQCCTAAAAAAAAPPALDAAERFTTTYTRTMQLDRARALASPPHPQLPAGRRFPLSSRLHADTWQQATLCADAPWPGGRGGARGAFTRWPAEAGSRYGVCVWADEYAAGR
jgi:hypothetical protein